MSEPAIRVGNFSAELADVHDRDARGLIHIFEEPKPNATYVIGVDPTVGLTGWDRSSRTRDDVSTDNGAIQVLRCGAQDVQVAEFAAPVDSIDLAAYANFLGRYYGGSNEDGQAYMLIEAYPGPGLTTIRELINRYGYQHFFYWTYLDTYRPKQSTTIGWYSSQRSRQVLWMKGMHAISKHQCVVRSPWLIEEMSDCTKDNFISNAARASSRRHDDRVVALLLALWGSREWSMEIEPSEAGGPEVADAVDWQRSDCSVERMMAEADERIESLLGNE